MATNQEDMYIFTLKFKEDWDRSEFIREFIREGRTTDPMKKNLRIRAGRDVDEAMENFEVQPEREKDFYIDDDGFIVPELSSGLSIYTDENHLRNNLNVKEQNLWKLGPSDGGTKIYYPEEMHLEEDDDDPTHFCIKPKRKVKPETFNQMLRCLPWVKKYQKDTQEGKKKAKQKKIQLVVEGQT